jgi:hypothetical protein
MSCACSALNLLNKHNGHNKRNFNLTTGKCLVNTHRGSDVTRDMTLDEVRTHCDDLHKFVLAELEKDTIGLERLTLLKSIAEAFGKQKSKDT